MEYYKLHPANRSIDGSNLRVTTEPWACCWLWSDGSERRLTVPEGYVYDGMSVPRIAWTFTGLHPDSGRAGVLPHDVLYRAKGGLKPGEFHGCTLTNHHGNTVCVSREEADFVLREFMMYSGESPVRCRRAHRWVRLFGSFFWGGPAPSFGGPS